MNMPYVIAQAILAEWMKRNPGQTFASRARARDSTIGIAPWPGQPPPEHEGDTCIIACVRLADRAEPASPARVAPCTECSAPVWLALETPIIPSGVILCMQCVAASCLRDMAEAAGKTRK